LLYLLTGQVFMGKKSFTKREYEVFLWSFVPKTGTKTPRMEQTNDCFHSANVQSGRLRVKKQSILVSKSLERLIQRTGE